MTLQILALFVLRWSGMVPYQMHLEHLARSILREKGIGAIWQLHLDAVYAYRTGYPVAANAIVDLADAIEAVRQASAPAELNWALIVRQFDDGATKTRCQLVCRGSSTSMAEGWGNQREQRAPHQLHRPGKRI